MLNFLRERIIRIAISAVASVKTSGVFVTVIFLFLASSRLIKITAAAPSLIPEALPAVTVPLLLNDGFDSYDSCADINSDGNLDVMDIIVQVNCILEECWEYEEPSESIYGFWIINLYSKKSRLC